MLKHRNGFLIVLLYFLSIMDSSKIHVVIDNNTNRTLFDVISRTEKHGKKSKRKIYSSLTHCRHSHPPPIKNVRFVCSSRQFLRKLFLPEAFFFLVCPVIKFTCVSGEEKRAHNNKRIKYQCRFPRIKIAVRKM